MLVNAQKQNRRHNRTNITVKNLKGSFRLLCGEQRLTDITLVDVSVSGAGLETAVPLLVGAELTLTLIAGDWELPIQGTVVWCQLCLDEQEYALHPPRYRIGIQLEPHNTHNNVLFFMGARTLIYTP